MYLVWGSTFLAIRYGLDSLPPFLMAGVRFLIAGSLFTLAAGKRSRARLTSEDWKVAAVLGILMITLANGLVTWAEQRVPSGIAALMWATFPFWLISLERFGPGGRTPRPRTVAGMGLGLVGASMLFVPAGHSTRAIDPVGGLVITLAVIAWTVATIYSRRIARPTSQVFASGIQMLIGGGVLVVLGALSGELSRFDPAAVGISSLVALGYLIVVGSLVFPIYLWLLRMTSPAKVSTEAYVCPVIALTLGTVIGGEAMTVPILGAAAVVLVGVALMVGDRGPEPIPARSAHQNHLHTLWKRR